MSRHTLFSRLLVVGVALALMLGFANTAKAGTFKLISLQKGLGSLGVYKILLNGTQTVYGLCVDQTHTIGFSSVSSEQRVYYNTVTGLSSASYVNATPVSKQQNVNIAGRIIDLALAKFANNLLNNNGAFEAQAAIWDVLTDGYDATWHDSGLVRSSGGTYNYSGHTAAIQALIDQAYTDVVTNNGGSPVGNPLIWDRNPPDGSVQDWAHRVPEPVFYQMAGLLALGGFGLLKARRRAR